MSDEATRKNILALKQHSDGTRKLFRALEDKYKQVEMLNHKIELLDKQVQNLLVVVHSGRTTR